MSKPKKAKQLYKTQIVVLILLCLGLGIGTALFIKFNRYRAPKHTGPIENISVGTVAEYSALVTIAQERGYFRKNGLNVTAKEYASGPPAVADVLAGKIDLATAADFVGVRNSFMGEDLRFLATVAKVESFYIAARLDHSISEPIHLKGKRVGITGKTAGEFYLGQFLIFNQMSLKDITIVDLPPAKLVEGLVKGELDAIVSFEPHITDIKNQLVDRTVVWSAQSSERLSTLLYGTGKLTSTRPEAIKRFLQALIDAEHFIKSNDKEARQIIARHLHYDAAFVGYIWPRYEFAVSLDQELLISLDSQARWVLENRLTPATKAPNYLRFIYFDGLEAVKPESITIIR